MGNGAIAYGSSHRAHPRLYSLNPGYEAADYPGTSSRIIAAPFSAIIMVGELVFPEVIAGITEASTTRRPSRPNTRSRSSTTASGSLLRPILAVPTGWKIVVPTSPAAFTRLASSSPTAAPGRYSCGWNG